MGIPYYFRYIVRENPSVLLHKPPPVCDRLYLDYNSIIHTCSAQVVGSRIWRNYNAMEKAIFTNIAQYTEYVVSQCPPRSILYLGVDGVAPMAKIMQQRRRRHMSAMRNTLLNNYKTQHGIPYSVWDSNCITPGTEFMKRLQAFLSSHFHSHYQFEVIISSHEEEGEGEHKIIKYIKALGNDGFTDVIYGLDADLMMLSLTCGKPKVYLMRESQQFGNNNNGSHKSKHNAHHHMISTPFKYVDIDCLGKCIASINGKIDMLYDYVFVCFLLGNDFLPHLPSLAIKTNGLDTLQELLKIVHSHHKQTLIELKDKRYTINMDMLAFMFSKLSDLEEELLVHNITQHEDKCSKPFRVDAANDLERYTKELEFSPLLNKQSQVRWNPKKEPENWKHMYYEDTAKIRYSDINAVDALCLSYIQGLFWNVDYYFNKQATHDWWYTHKAAPCISDINTFLQKTHITSNKDKQYQMHPTAKHRNLTSSQQLMMVLPYQSFHILPHDIREYLSNYKNGMMHMYPVTFELDMSLKSQLWECTPLLPDIDVDKIMSSVFL